MSVSSNKAAAIERYLEDASVATNRHVASSADVDEPRRHIDHALQAIYRAHNGLKDETGYWQRAEASRDGQTLLALLYVRGRMEHEVLVDVHEPEVLVPGEQVVPSADLHTGLNYWWKVPADMAPHLTPGPTQRDRRELVFGTLAGRLIPDTLRTAAGYLGHELARARSNDEGVGGGAT